jgi:hypothetical protein
MHTVYTFLMIRVFSPFFFSAGFPEPGKTGLLGWMSGREVSIESTVFGVLQCCWRYDLSLVGRRL